MPRLILSGTTIALALIVSTLALGCSRDHATARIDGTAQASPSPATWVKLADVGGSLSGWSRGRSSIDVDVKSGGVRFVVTVGAAPGWGASVAKFRYWLYRRTEMPPLGAFPLHATVTSNGDWKTYDLRSPTPLPPGTYSLLYNGAGWYQMAVYLSAQG